MTRKETITAMRRRPAWERAFQRRALEIHTWSNTDDDWRALDALYVISKVPHYIRHTIPEGIWT